MLILLSTLLELKVFPRSTRLCVKFWGMVTAFTGSYIPLVLNICLTTVMFWYHDYRAFLFGYIEILLNTMHSCPVIGSSELVRMTNAVETSHQHLIDVGYDEYAFQTFYDIFMELLQSLPKLSASSWYSKFIDDDNTNYYTWFMRLITACK